MASCLKGICRTLEPCLLKPSFRRFGPLPNKTALRTLSLCSEVKRPRSCRSYAIRFSVSRLHFCFRRISAYLLDDGLHGSIGDRGSTAVLTWQIKVMGASASLLHSLDPATFDLTPSTMVVAGHSCRVPAGPLHSELLGNLLFGGPKLIRAWWRKPPAHFSRHTGCKS